VIKKETRRLRRAEGTMTNRRNGKKRRRLGNDDVILHPVARIDTTTALDEEDEDKDVSTAPELPSTPKGYRVWWRGPYKAPEVKFAEEDRLSVYKGSIVTPS